MPYTIWRGISEGSIQIGQLNICKLWISSLASLGVCITPVVVCLSACIVYMPVVSIAGKFPICPFPHSDLWVCECFLWFACICSSIGLPGHYAYFVLAFGLPCGLVISWPLSIPNLCMCMTYGLAIFPFLVTHANLNTRLLKLVCMHAWVLALNLIMSVSFGYSHAWWVFACSCSICMLIYNPACWFATSLWSLGLMLLY